MGNKHKQAFTEASISSASLGEKIAFKKDLFIMLWISMMLILVILWGIEPIYAETENSKSEANLNSLDLPEALLEDDSFDDLPFEQLRQALREEVERGPKLNSPKYSKRKYNLLIR